MKTSLIIPFKNELDYAELTMSKAYSFMSDHHLNFELVAVDDSTDGTWDILTSFANSHSDVIAVKGGQPPGYGRALRKGFEVATGDIIIPFNGDLSDSLEDVLSYIEIIQSGYEMVFGSRFMSGAMVTSSTATKNLASRLGNTFLQLLFWSQCSDITNSFKAYRKIVLDEIKPIANGYNIVMEIALKSIARKYKYTTIPVTYTERKYGRSKMSVIKIIPKYLLTALKIRFFYRSR